MIRLQALATAVILAVCSLAANTALGEEPADAPRIELREPQDAAGRRFVIVGLPPAALERLSSDRNGDWSNWFAVDVLPPDGAAADLGLPHVAGDYGSSEGAVWFEPRYELAPGVTYRATFDASRMPPDVLAGLGPGARSMRLSDEFSIAKPVSAKPASVVAVYPTTSRLAENHLKFYIHFSAPMRRGEAYRHVHLLRADGTEVELPFLELGEELWDPSYTRFTLFFDPGRIKRGLRPREEEGPALEEGKSYTFVVDKAWRDAEGRPLTAEFRKPFEVGAPDDTSPDIGAWRIEPPAAGTRSPLVVRLPEPLDHALLHRVLAVVDADGRTVDGQIETGDAETRWQFVPERAWRPGRYALVADTVLEDLSGNSLGRAFEVDILHPIERRVTSSVARREFEVQREGANTPPGETP